MNFLVATSTFVLSGPLLLRLVLVAAQKRLPPHTAFVTHCTNRTKGLKRDRRETGEEVIKAVIDQSTILGNATLKICSHRNIMYETSVVTSSFCTPH